MQWLYLIAEKIGGHVQLSVSGLLVECRPRDFQVTGSNLTADHLQQP